MILQMTVLYVSVIKYLRDWYCGFNTQISHLSVSSLDVLSSCGFDEKTRPSRANNHLHDSSAIGAIIRDFRQYVRLTGWPGNLQWEDGGVDSLSGEQRSHMSKVPQPCRFRYGGGVWRIWHGLCDAADYRKACSWTSGEAKLGCTTRQSIFWGNNL